LALQAALGDGLAFDPFSLPVLQRLVPTLPEASSAISSVAVTSAAFIVVHSFQTMI
jgi:hypothetical protein